MHQNGKILRIVKWSETFETAESRTKIKAMQWFACPSGCESNGFLTLSGRGLDGVQALGVFLALAQGYSGKYRNLGRDGAFTKAKGKGMRLEEIAALIRLPFDIVASAVELLASEEVEWLEWIPESNCNDSYPDTIQTASGQSQDTIPTVHTHTGQESTGEDKTREYTHTARASASEIDPIEVEDIIRKYCRASGKQHSAEAAKAIVLILRGGTGMDELAGKVQAICDELEKLPGSEKRFLPSCYDFFQDDRWKSEPSSFTIGRTPNGDTVSATKLKNLKKV